jgi:hypothetical protein
MTTVDEAPDHRQYGEVVDITITGATVSGPIADRILYGVGDDTLQLTIGNPAITITRATPADGEPQPGDIWRDRQDIAYAAITNRVSGVDRVDLVRIDGKGTNTHWPFVHKGLSGPIRLVYRLTDSQWSAS